MDQESSELELQCDLQLWIWRYLISKAASQSCICNPESTTVVHEGIVIGKNHNNNFYPKKKATVVSLKYVSNNTYPDASSKNKPNVWSITSSL